MKPELNDERFKYVDAPRRQGKSFDRAYYEYVADLYEASTLHKMMYGNPRSSTPVGGGGLLREGEALNAIVEKPIAHPYSMNRAARRKQVALARG